MMAWRMTGPSPLFELRQTREFTAREQRDLTRAELVRRWQANRNAPQPEPSA